MDNVSGPTVKECSKYALKVISVMRRMANCYLGKEEGATPMARQGYKQHGKKPAANHRDSADFREALWRKGWGKQKLDGRRRAVFKYGP